MKSIVLCERSLSQESEDYKNLKEEKINEGNNEKAIGKKILNGSSDSKKFETQVQNSEKSGVTIHNGDKRCSKASFKEEIVENDRNRRPCAVESVSKENLLTGKADPSAGITRNTLCSDKAEIDYSLGLNLSSENENVKILDTQNGSAHVEDPSLSSEMDFSIENGEIGDATVQVIVSDKSGTSRDTIGDSLRKSIDANLVEEGKLIHAESKENVQLLDDIVLDLDENKENEKEEKTIVMNDFSGNDLTSKHSNGCEIQVGKVETISGLEKESMWAENEFKKSEKDSLRKSEGRLMDECEEINISNEDSLNVIESEKEEENHEFVTDENLVSEGEEISEEGMHIELEESDQVEEEKIEDKKSEHTDLNTFYGTKRTAISESKDDKRKLAKAEKALCRKRQQMFESNDEDPFTKKKRLSEDKEVQLDEDKTDGSSLCASLSSLDTTETLSKDEGKVLKGTKKSSINDKDLKKCNASATNREASTEKQEGGEAMFSVLEKFRGSLKTLTRSDLEELIIQKLCEVITERSNVGELRQKAQALEQDQERWKARAQSLTKQMREMEMVMKKYMNEVQKQVKEGDPNVITPLKVTRSVGLQVSFYSSTTKGPKPNLSELVSSGTTTPRYTKSTSPKLSSQFSQVTPNAKNKTAPFLPKSLPSLQKNTMNQQKRPIAPKPDYGSNTTNRSTGQQSLLNNNRGVPNPVQASRPSCKPVIGAPPQLSPAQQLHQKQQPSLHKQQQQKQQQQQNGSKVIDLTEDDDRQTGNIGMFVKTSGSIRVVNHLTQPTASQNNRFAYLLPTTSASTGTSAGQNRQVLIATPTMPQPNRQIMCSMPPLLFKGGNVVQTSSPQSNKVILPKTLRHPAPLPQRPVNQNTRPSLKLLPPRPALKISKVQTGIVLSWNMSLSPEHAPISSYQLYAYQESDSPPTTSLWKKVGDVKALPLPMACTLTQFMSGHKYHFAVRAVDLHSRIGPFSFPGTIVLV